MRSSSRRPVPWIRAASRVPGGAALLLAAVLGACDVAWGGASLKLEDPAPKDTAADSAGGGERGEPVPELPDGRLLYVVRLDSTGGARAAPAARLVDRGLAPVGWPDDPPPVYLERFAAAFQPPGAELPLLSGGARVGTLVISGRQLPAGDACPDAATGQALLPPGRRPPEFAFALSPRDSAPPPAAGPGPASTRRLRVFAPIVAERLLQGAGVERAYLARRVDLRPVSFPGDTAPGMAATFLIRDSLTTSPPPAGASTSLFFLARWDRGEGFVPVWSRVRRYDSAEGKEILTHMGWIRTAGGAIHLARRFTTEGLRLAAFRLDGATTSGELAWVEPGACPALEALRLGVPRAAPAAGADAAP